MRKVLVLMIYLCVLVGCTGNKKDADIKIGAILPLSGSTAVIGEPKFRAFEIARDFYKDKGYNIEFIYEDSKGLAKDGVTTLSRMINDKSINYYYIDLTPIVNASIPIIDDKKVITFAGSAEPKVTDSSDYLFRLFAGGDQEIELIVSYLLKNNIQNIYVLHTNELYGSSAADLLRNNFVTLGGNVTGQDEYPMNETDFKNILIKARESSADKIILLGYGNEYEVLLKQAYELNIPSDRFICNLGGSNKVVTELPSEFTNNMIFIGPQFTFMLNNNSLSAQSYEFVDLYKSRYNDVPDFRAAYAFDTVSILLKAVAESQANNTTVADEIVKIKNYFGVSGTITFFENGDSATDLVVAKYDQGKIILCD